MAAVPINITVTPVGVAGTDVDCDFAGPNVVDNAAVLPNGGTYDITFQLVPAQGVTGFAAQRPFCNQPNRCPRPPGGNATPPFRLTSNTGNAITVHLDPVGNKGVSYYRLNFNNNLNCDPIIIHD
jgi:hypothetical protein